MVDDARIIALANGEPVGGSCYCCAGSGKPLGSVHGEPPPCHHCHGTGRIDTEPRDEAERAVAKLRKAFEEVTEAEVGKILDVYDTARKILRLKNECNEAYEALEAERAAHQLTKAQADTAFDSLVAEQANHEEMKRQLADADACIASHDGVRTALLRVQDERDQALREKAEAEAACAAAHRDIDAARHERNDAQQRLAASEEALRARTRQIERWQHAAHHGCATDPDGKFICGEATPGDFARAVNRLLESELARKQMREALLKARRHLGHPGTCLYDGVPGRACTCVCGVVDDALATPSPEGVMEKVRGLVVAVESGIELWPGGYKSLRAIQEALAALYAILPGVKP